MNLPTGKTGSWFIKDMQTVSRYLDDRSLQTP